MTLRCQARGQAWLVRSPGPRASDLRGAEESPRFPLKGSFKGDIGIDIEVAVKELNLSYPNMDIVLIIWFCN